jgi:hypothetical protein
VLTEAEPSWSLGDISAAPAVGDSLADYLRLGADHILSGSDHLVFLLALLLLGGTLRDVVRIVTGFTVAHSITLGLDVFDIVRPAAAPIEALIGLSIALVAAENLWLAGARGGGRVPALTLGGVALFAACYLALVARAAQPATLRAAVAFLFGLVHGFGFAGVLLGAALPSERLARALVGFNAGVELGQVAVVLAFWALLRLMRRWREGRYYRDVIEYGSAAILALGMFWFVGRSYGSSDATPVVAMTQASVPSSTSARAISSTVTRRRQS